MGDCLGASGLRYRFDATFVTLQRLLSFIDVLFISLSQLSHWYYNLCGSLIFCAFSISVQIRTCNLCDVQLSNLWFIHSSWAVCWTMPRHCWPTRCRRRWWRRRRAQSRTPTAQLRQCTAAWLCRWEGQGADVYSLQKFVARTTKIIM